MNRQLSRRFGPYLEIVRALWDNKDQLPYAWRILNDGVCDGCALGTSGMKDWTMDGPHLCWIRLNLLRLNTAPAFDPAVLNDVSALRGQSEKDLRELGRLPCPMIRRKGWPGFQRTTWSEAMTELASRMEGLDPHRFGFYMVSRGAVNETYYVAQKVARYLGTSHVDNSARVCHAPSTVALKSTIGYAAPTCSYNDLFGCDLVVFIGSDPANNQPVFMKYMDIARKQGVRVATINPFKEPGLERYWVPSSPQSALLGTTITDDFFQVEPGGDIAFLNGVLKLMIEHGWVDMEYVRKHTEGWDALEAVLAGQSFEELEAQCGLTREDMLRFAKLYAAADSCILIWSMGITMHSHGVENVQAIVNLGLSRGLLGKAKSGLVPIRGHSGVQGGAEMGCVPTALPGGAPLSEADRFSRLWGFEVPSWRGMYVGEMVDAAHRGDLDVLYCAGSNLFGVLPDSRYVKEAVRRLPVRVHHDIILNPQMLVEPEDTVILLPATTRYEMVGGNCETTSERRVIFNPEIPGPRIPEARDEWRVLVELAQRLKPEGNFGFADTAAIRREIAQAVPFYAGIEKLARKGDQFQWGGHQLARDGKFPTPDGKAHFIPLSPPRHELPAGKFQLSTRRGKQFNSMVWGSKDMLVGGSREDILMDPADIERHGLREGQSVTVRSETGELAAIVRPCPGARTGMVQMYWPEANVLIGRSKIDPQCGIPAYRETNVEIVPR